MGIITQKTRLDYVHTLVRPAEEEITAPELAQHRHPPFSPSPPVV